MITTKNPKASNGLKYVCNTDWKKELIMPTELIIDNHGNINISEKLWIKLNEKYSRHEIKRLISRTILDHNVPLPLKTISYRTTKKTFHGLRLLRSRNYCKRGTLFSRFDYKWPISDVYIDASNRYNVASNYFHQANRWRAGSQKHPSPSDAWFLKKHHNTFLNNLWSMNRKKVNKGIFNSAINLKIYVASQFKPAAAKIFYELFNARNVLDLSSGWGDRLCGFCASSAQKYVGLDPNTSLIEGYQKQIQAYGQNKDITMVCTGSEFYDPQKQKFDTIFTSPPYFAIEHYSTDEGQSFKQYSSFDLWFEKFFVPTLDMAWDSLDVSDFYRGGILCINISDVLIGKNRYRICDKMNDYLQSKGGRYIGCIGLRLALRPNIVNEEQLKASKNAIFIEPMWIWAKKGVWKLEDYIKNGFIHSFEPKGLF